METRPGIGPLVVPVIVQGVVGVVLLIGFWLVLGYLPMLQEVYLDLPFGLSELITALIMTGIVAVLMSTAGRLAFQFGTAGVGFPQAGLAVRLLALLGALLIVYHAYFPLLQPYLGQYEWIYQVACLAAFLATLVALGYTVYSGVGDLSAAMAARPRPARAPGRACGQCGAVNPPGSAFCAACGAPPRPARAAACARCGTAMQPGARFCPSCGTASATHPVRPAAPARPVPPPPAAPACASCGAPLRPGAKFCGKCGASPGEPAEEEAPAQAGEDQTAEESPRVPVCASCGAALGPGAKFCAKCGSPQQG